MIARSNLPAFRALSPATVEGLQRISMGTKESGLDPSLVELVKLRVSQINGCAFCLHTHLTEARKLNIKDEVMHLLPAWRESTYFTDRERAALAWAESLTLVAEDGVPDSVFGQAASQFSEAELANLTGAIIAINGFNRVAVTYRFAHPAN